MRDPLRWAIVGGGIHGTHLALRLLGEGIAAPGELKVFDRFADPLHRWTRTARRIGMRYLRSPRVHHLGSDPQDLVAFTRTVRGTLDRSPWLGPYRRPSTELFARHTAALAEAVDLAANWQAEAVTRIEPSGEGGWTIRTEHDAWRADRVVLAVGGTAAHWPEWAGPVSEAAPDRIAHAFGADDLAPPDRHAATVIVGGGLSGAQWALERASRGEPVVLLTRRHLDVAPFDTDPGWLGPRHMQAFLREADPGRRRTAIDGARLQGTVTGEIRLEVARARREGRLETRVGQVRDVSVDATDGLVRLQVVTPEGDCESIPASGIGLATGFGPGLPGGTLVERLVAACRPPTAACGFPITGRDLAWMPGLHVMGRLAELELGPVAGNISGARRAADRILGPAPRVLGQSVTWPLDWIPFPSLSAGRSA